MCIGTLPPKKGTRELLGDLDTSAVSLQSRPSLVGNPGCPARRQIELVARIHCEKPCQERLMRVLLRGAKGTKPRKLPFGHGRRGGSISGFSIFQKRPALTGRVVQWILLLEECASSRGSPLWVVFVAQSWIKWVPISDQILDKTARQSEEFDQTWCGKRSRKHFEGRFQSETNVKPSVWSHGNQTQEKLGPGSPNTPRHQYNAWKIP